MSKIIVHPKQSQIRRHDIISVPSETTVKRQSLNAMSMARASEVTHHRRLRRRPALNRDYGHVM